MRIFVRSLSYGEFDEDYSSQFSKNSLRSYDFSNNFAMSEKETSVITYVSLKSFVFGGRTSYQHFAFGAFLHCARKKR